MARRGGLECLANALYFLERSDTAKAVQQYVRKWYSHELLSPNEHDAVVDELDALVPQQKLHGYYAMATGETPKRRFADLDDLLHEIEQRKWSKPGHPLMRLTEAIAAEAHDDPQAAERARKWSDLLAERIEESKGLPGTEREILEKLRSGEIETPAGMPGPPTLIFQLDPARLRPNYYHFTSWLFFGKAKIEKVHQSEDGDPVTLECVRESLSEILDLALIKADQAHKPVRELHLEFILPRDLLCVPVEEWTNREPYMSLGVQFVVVVRDLVRQRDRQRGIFWSRKWEMLLEGAVASESNLKRWITCADAQAEPGEMYRKFLADEYVSLALTFNPGDDTHKFELAEALDAGVPIVIWPRQCVHSGNSLTDFQNDLRARLAGQVLTALPKIVLGMRRQAGKDHRRAVTLLWDDYTMRPELDRYPLDAPGPLGRAL